MSLPHQIFQCNRCTFRHFALPDAHYTPNEQGQVVRLWGEECVCAACASQHLLGRVYGPNETHQLEVWDVYFLTGKTTRRWYSSTQKIQALPWFVTARAQHETVFDLRDAKCTACGKNALQFFLYPGSACPACKAGELTTEFSG